MHRGLKLLSCLACYLSWEDNIDDVNYEHCGKSWGGYFTPTAPEPPKQVKYALRVFALSSCKIALYFLTIAGHYSEIIKKLAGNRYAFLINIIIFCSYKASIFCTFSLKVSEGQLHLVYSCL